MKKKKKRTNAEIIQYLLVPTDLPAINDLTEEDQRLAKERLLGLLGRAREMLPISEIETFWHSSHAARGNFHYISKLYRIKKLLDERDWYNACRDFADVIRYYRGYDRRTINTIVCMLEDALC